MFKETYSLSLLDLEFLFAITKELGRLGVVDPLGMLIDSFFLDRFEEDKEYMYHHEESYWAYIIYYSMQSHRVH